MDFEDTGSLYMRLQISTNIFCKSVLVRLWNHPQTELRSKILLGALFWHNQSDTPNFSKYQGTFWHIENFYCVT